MEKIKTEKEKKIEKSKNESNNSEEDNIDEKEEEDYNKRKDKLNSEFQKENYARLLRISENKRREILEKHQLMKEKFDKKKTKESLVQTLAINKKLYEQESTKPIIEVLRKMQKDDPTKEFQRRRLLNAMIELNKRFHFNLPINESTKNKPKMNTMLNFN